MTLLSAPGDPAFGFSADGRANVRFGHQAPVALSLNELVALSTARTQSPAGSTAAQLVERLTAGSGEEPWAEVVGSLVKKGLLRQSSLPLPPGTPAFALEAGDAEGTLMREILHRLPGVTPLEPTELPLAIADFLEASAPDAQQLVVGYDGCRDAAMRCGNDLVGTLARALGKPQWLQFVPARANKSVDRIDRLYDGRVRWVFLIRHPLDFVEAAYRSFSLVNPMVLFPSIWPTLLAEREGDFHQAIAAHWADFACTAHRVQRGSPERVAFVRYEELTSNPDRTIERLSAFLLGESAAFVAPETSKAPGADAAWLRWPRPLVQRLAPIVNQGLEQLSYPPIG